MWEQRMAMSILRLTQFLFTALSLSLSRIDRRLPCRNRSNSPASQPRRRHSRNAATAAGARSAALQLGQAAASAVSCSAGRAASEAVSADAGSRRHPHRRARCRRDQRARPPAGRHASRRWESICKWCVVAVDEIRFASEFSWGHLSCGRLAALAVRCCVFTAEDRRKWCVGREITDQARPLRFVRDSRLQLNRRIVFGSCLRESHESRVYEETGGKTISFCFRFFSAWPVFPFIFLKNNVQFFLIFPTIS